MSERRRVQILGVGVDDLVEGEALARCVAMIAAGGPHHVVTVNPEFVMEARRNPAFARVLRAADLATPDGFGLLIASRYLGLGLRGRVTGVELTLRLAQEAARRGWRVFLLGAAPGVAEQAATVLKQRCPGLVVAGCYAGSPAVAEEPHIRALVAAARPDILLVAYGHPRQDLWVARNQPLMRVPLAMGVGGVFDYLSGRVPRAPGWVRRIGLEWLYRLARQPRRLRRIGVAVPLFLWAVMSARRPQPQGPRPRR